MKTINDPKVKPQHRDKPEAMPSSAPKMVLDNHSYTGFSASDFRKGTICTKLEREDLPGYQKMYSPEMDAEEDVKYNEQGKQDADELEDVVDIEGESSGKKEKEEPEEY